jgi:phosphoribosylamine--glycine ligase
MVVGSGGREHALAWRLARDPGVSEVISVPGNPGTAQFGRRFAAADPVEVARRVRPALVVIGPEQPLCAGLADTLDRAGVLAFGPTAAAARLEGSKAFAKEFMERHGIPTAVSVRTSELPVALDWIASRELPVVVKDSHLAGGKGVTVAESRAEAGDAARQVLAREGGEVVIEEFLAGEELSVFAISDGVRHLLLPVCRDHKRAFDGDTGPMTGGMGAFTPVPDAGPGVVERAVAECVVPALTGMAGAGTPFRGVLFAGMMLTPTGPRVLEYNVRFGDPEAQALLPLVEGDLTGTLGDAAEGALNPAALRASGDACAVVVMACEGYPLDPRTGDEITGLDALPEGALVFHAGTAEKDGKLVTAGGRVLGVTAVRRSLPAAVGAAYAALEPIRFKGAHWRGDIGRPPGG